MSQHPWCLLWIGGGLSALGCGGLDDRSPGVVAPRASQSSEPRSWQSDNGSAEPSGSAVDDTPTPGEALEQEAGDEGDDTATLPVDGMERSRSGFFSA